MDELIVLIVKAIYNALRDKSQDTPAQRAAQEKQMQAIRGQMRFSPTGQNRAPMIEQLTRDESDILVARLPPPALAPRSPMPATMSPARTTARPTSKSRPGPKARAPKRSIKPSAPPPLPGVITAAAKTPAPAAATPPASLTVATARSLGSTPQLSARDVIALLGRTSIRKQIVLNEILQPPLSLR